MFKERMKKIILTILVFSCIAIPVYADSVEDIRARQIEDGIYYLLYLRQQIQAVDNDMFFYFGWMPDDKKGMKITAHDCVRELDRFKSKLMARQMPLELAEAKVLQADIIEKQKRMYLGVELKTGEQIKAGYAEFQKALDQHIEYLGKQFSQYLTAERVSDDFSILDEELKLFIDTYDKDLFLEADRFSKLLQFKESHKILTLLREKYKGTPAEPVIMLRLSDGYLNSDSDIESVEGGLNTQEAGLGLLNEILSKNEYSPVLSEVFDKWRCKYQEQNHGMSNYSTIPNIKYNDRRMEIVKVIQNHLIQHPEDNWAKVQILSLLMLDNIFRGDTFGNSNLRHLAANYMNFDHEKSEPTPEDTQRTKDLTDALKAVEAPVGWEE